MENSNNVTESATFVVVGGGIAGVTCAETISNFCVNATIILLTESSLIKTVTCLEPLTKRLFKFDVQECAVDKAKTTLSSTIRIIVDCLQYIEADKKHIYTRSKRIISYQYLCICTGGRPRLIDANNPRIIGIRDTDSVHELQQRLQTARKLAIVGNGGIATELAYEVKNVEIHWIVKDDHIASTFVDPGAAHFFQQSTQHPQITAADTGAIKRMRYDEMSLMNSALGTTGKRGAALGPDWHRKFDISGADECAPNCPKMYYNAHIISITSTLDGPLFITLANNECIACDFLVSATGVDARLDFSCNQTLKLSEDGFIVVNEMMETNIKAIYAAGDICSAGWVVADNWFQMRLWTQARQMGAMAGRSMVSAFQKEQIYQDFCFELFGHVTTLFGFQVVLLGCYNGQGLGNDYEILLRTTPGKEYIKFVLSHGRLRGAILIGNSELAETCENLILNGLDLTPFGDDILNPDIDIEDFFD